MAETIEKAAVKYLSGLSDVVAVVGKTPESLKPFIFRDEMLDNLESNKYEPVSALVVEDGGPLAVNAITRYRARRLRITIWANGSRGPLGNLISPATVTDKINDTFLAFDKYLHRTSPEPVQWSTITTIASERLIDLSEPVAISDGDGIQIASVTYSVFF